MLFQKQSQRRPSSAARCRTTRPLQVEQLEHRFCPSYTLVTSRATLAGTDWFNWATLGAPGTSIANPITAPSTAGQSITVSKTLSGSFLLDEQWGATTGNSYVIHGNFAPGDIVLDTNSPPHTGRQNTITLNFGGTPMAAGGAQIMTNLYGSFTAEIDALDAKGKTLARFTEAGNATDAADNSAIFLGISSSSPTICQISVSITQAANTQYVGLFAINKFDFRKGTLAVAPAPRQSTSGLNEAPLAFSLQSAEQPAIRLAPLDRSMLPSAPSASTGSSVQTHQTKAAAAAGAVDIVFAESGGALTDDIAWLSGSLSGLSLGGI